jgi:glutamine cyclotransferase
MRIMKRSTAEIVREHGPFPGVDRVHGVTYDGEQVWFASGDKLNALDPASGELQRSIDVPAKAGTAFDGQHLFQIADGRIQKIDPKTGAVLRTIESTRHVTGVSWVDGELWHGTWEDNDESDVRRIDPRTGEVLESLEMPPGVGVSGLESDGGDRFFCGGGRSGKVRVIRRPKRDPRIPAHAASK